MGRTVDTETISNRQVLEGLWALGVDPAKLQGLDTNLSVTDFSAQLSDRGIGYDQWKQARGLVAFRAKPGDINDALTTLGLEGLSKDQLVQVISRAKQLGGGQGIRQGGKIDLKTIHDLGLAPSDVGYGVSSNVGFGMSDLLQATGEVTGPQQATQLKIKTGQTQGLTQDQWNPFRDDHAPDAAPAPAPSVAPGREGAVGLGQPAPAAPSIPAAKPVVPTTEPKTKGEVAALQTALNAGGAGLTVDGVMGPKTRAAWQKQGGPGAPAATPKGAPGTPAPTPTPGPPAPDVLAKTAPVADQIAYIKSHYGYAAWALDDPEIGPKILQAAHDGWDKAKFEGAIFDTNWWKTHDSTQRVRQNEQGTDPATYGAGVAGMKAQIQKEAGTQGVTIDASRLDQMATDAYTSGWKPEQITAGVAAEFHYDPNAAKQPGEVGDLKSIASSYLVPLDDHTIQQWGGDILAGRSNDAAFTEYIKGQAKGLFPTMSAAIDAGQTVTQYVAPYKSTIAQTLEINPNDVSFMDQKYMKLLTTIDPKTNAPVAKPLYEAMNDIRKDPTYGYQNTQQAKDQAASFSQKLASTWGIG